MDGDAEPIRPRGRETTGDGDPGASQTALAASRARQAARRSRRRWSRLIVGVVATASAIGAGAAGCHPTGVHGVDVVYAALAAVVVTLAASRASRSTLLVLTAVAVVMSRGWLLAPAAVALLAAFAAVVPRRAHQRLGALVGALVIQVVLRWPPVGFHGSTALVAIAAILPVGFSAWQHLSRHGRRRTVAVTGALLGLAVVFSALAALGGLLARPQVNHGLAAAHEALQGISLTDVSTQSSITQLRTASVALEAAHARADAWWSIGGRLVPVVAQQRQAIATATSAGYDLTAAASREASDLDLQGLRYEAGHINLSALEATAAPVSALDQQLATAQARLSGIRSSWLVAPITTRLDHLGSELAGAHKSADLAAAAVKVAPAILGADGARHYFVAFMTPAETRGLGGFIGAWAEVTVDEGRITLSQAGQPAQLNAALGKVSPQLTGLAQYVARYGPFHPATQFEDVTYSPDLPTVAKVITELYSQAGGGGLDGVLVLDPQALATLLTLTGPITVPGLPQPLTSATADNVLLRQQYDDLPLLGGSNTVRHDLLQEALSQAFTKLSSGSLPGPAQLADLLSPEVRQGRLLFWSNHAAEDPLLSRLGLAGAFPQPGPASDVLAVTVANAANNKIDAYLHEGIHDSVRYDPSDGQVKATVTITLDNTAPGSGLPDEVIGSYAGSGLPPGTNYAWLSLYTPFEIGEATADGRAIGFSPGTEELGVGAYSTFLTVPAGTTKTVVVGLTGTLPPGPHYQMALRIQPLAYPTTVSVSEQPTSGRKTSSAQSVGWTPDDDMVQAHTWMSAKS